MPAPHSTSCSAHSKEKFASKKHVEKWAKRVLDSIFYNFFSIRAYHHQAKPACKEQVSISSEPDLREKEKVFMLKSVEAGRGGLCDVLAWWLESSCWDGNCSSNLSFKLQPTRTPHLTEAKTCRKCRQNLIYFLPPPANSSSHQWPFFDWLILRCFLGSSFHKKTFPTDKLATMRAIKHLIKVSSFARPERHSTRTPPWHYCRRHPVKPPSSAYQILHLSPTCRGLHGEKSSNLIKANSQRYDLMRPILIISGFGNVKKRQKKTSRRVSVCADEIISRKLGAFDHRPEVR